MVRDWAAKRGRRLSELGSNISGASAVAIDRAARRRLRQRVLAGSGSTAAQAISFWAMFTRQPAFSYIAPAMLTSHVLPLTPVLARPYLERLLRLRGSQIIGKNFYRTMIARGFPALATVPNANTGRLVTAEPAAISWRPTSIDDLYTRLPVAFQRLAHVVLGRLRRNHGSVDSSSEAMHWSAVLAEGGESDVVRAGSLTVQAGPESDIHIRAVARGLRWTADYLQHSVDELGVWK